MRYYYSISLKNKFHKKSFFFFGGVGGGGSAFVFFLGAKLLKSFNLRKTHINYFKKMLKNNFRKIFNNETNIVLKVVYFQMSCYW